MPQNWVARVVNEERRKDQTHSREVAAAVHNAEVVRFTSNASWSLSRIV